MKSSWPQPQSGSMSFWATKQRLRCSFKWTPNYGRSGPWAWRNGFTYLVRMYEFERSLEITERAPSARNCVEAPISYEPKGFNSTLHFQQLQFKSQRLKTLSCARWATEDQPLFPTSEGPTITNLTSNSNGRKNILQYIWWRKIGL